MLILSWGCFQGNFIGWLDIQSDMKAVTCYSLSEQKKIDFALAIKPYQDNNVWIPLVGLEVKKYCDKTMFGTILETYKSLQIFRPRTYYGFLIEDESRGKDVVLNSPMYSQEFILCGVRDRDKLNPVRPKELKRFAGEISIAMIEACTNISRHIAGDG